MKTLSKICDAADWFDEEFAEVVKNELREPARFHRKQWEFAQIFLSLRKLGFLKADKIGLSLGGGNERVLYSIANHINKLVVTDLYDDSTDWDCARTNDPNEYIKASKPFPVDDDKIEALRMDMRFLEFEDNTFDFCYSSCAFEHIGDYEDFAQHLNEVYRVLKEDGVYVFTTELQFDEETIKDPHNYIFAKDYLTKLISESKLNQEFNVDAKLDEHFINKPYPSNLKNLMFNSINNIGESLFQNFQHIILLRGKVPFTSVLFVLRKSKFKSEKQIEFLGYDKSKSFLTKSLKDYEILLSKKELSISPFSMLPNGVSRFFLDHSDFFNSASNINIEDKTLFHSDYFWLGKGSRTVKITFKINSSSLNEANKIQLRIHKYETLNSTIVESVYEKNIFVITGFIIQEVISLEIADDCNYAFLGKIILGNCVCSDISIKINSLTHNETITENLGESRKLEGVLF